MVIIFSFIEYKQKDYQNFTNVGCRQKVFLIEEYLDDSILILHVF